jgi:hypothetical protein
MAAAAPGAFAALAGAAAARAGAAGVAEFCAEAGEKTDAAAAIPANATTEMIEVRAMATVRCSCVLRFPATPLFRIDPRWTRPTGSTTFLRFSGEAPR